MTQALITGRHRRRRDRVGQQRKCWSTARRSRRCSHPVRRCSASRSPPTATVIDATGKYVIPGGIDGAHPHGDAVRRHATPRDTFETGTRAAAWGGTTTIIDFVVQAHGQRVQDQVGAWHDKADGNCAIDYGFHQIIGDVDDGLAQGDGRAGRRGDHQLQAVMAYPGVFLSGDGQILQAMQTAAGNGGMIMMHAENGSAIDVLVRGAGTRRDCAAVPRRLTRPGGPSRKRPARSRARRPHRRA